MKSPLSALAALFVGSLFNRSTPDPFGEVVLKEPHKNPGSLSRIVFTEPPPSPNLTPLPRVIPSGCKRYFFNNQGVFCHDNRFDREKVFQCIASSDRVAKDKFAKFKAKQAYESAASRNLI